MTKPLSKMSRSELVDACIKEQQRSAALAAHVERFAGLLRELDYTMPVTPHLPMARIKGEYLERVEQALDELPTHHSRPPRCADEGRGAG